MKFCLNLHRLVLPVTLVALTACGAGGSASSTGSTASNDGSTQSSAGGSVNPAPQVFTGTSAQGITAAADGSVIRITSSGTTSRVDIESTTGGASWQGTMQASNSTSISHQPGMDSSNNVFTFAYGSVAGTLGSTTVQYPTLFLEYIRSNGANLVKTTRLPMGPVNFGIVSGTLIGDKVVQAFTFTNHNGFSVGEMDVDGNGIWGTAGYIHAEKGAVKSLTVIGDGTKFAYVISNFAGAAYIGKYEVGTGYQDWEAGNSSVMQIRSAQVGADGNIYVAIGDQNTLTGFACFDSNWGSLKWSKSFNAASFGLDPTNVAAGQISADSNGNLYVSVSKVSSSSYATDPSTSLISYDSQGNVRFQKKYSSAQFLGEVGNLAVGKNGLIYGTGNMGSGGSYLAKFNSSSGEFSN